LNESCTLCGVLARERWQGSGSILHDSCIEWGIIARERWQGDCSVMHESCIPWEFLASERWEEVVVSCINDVKLGEFWIEGEMAGKW
jgi:hypothetical protein